MSVPFFKKSLGAAIVAAAALVILPSRAHAASITFQLNVNGCSSTCLPGGISGGTIVITDGLETGEVQVQVTLAPGFHFANSSGKGQLAFDLSGDPPIGIDDLTDTGDFSLEFSGASGESISLPPFSNTPDTPFEYAIVCSTCQGGQTTNPTGPVTFDVVLTGVTVNSFIGNGPTSSTGFFFATDVLAANGNTGDIGAGPGVLTVSGTPEPATLVLFGSGLVAAASRLRRKPR